MTNRNGCLHIVLLSKGVGVSLALFSMSKTN